jgi:hypothetical protein
MFGKLEFVVGLVECQLESQSVLRRFYGQLARAGYLQRAKEMCGTILAPEASAMDRGSFKKRFVV